MDEEGKLPVRKTRLEVTKGILKMIRRASELGATENEIAELCDVSPSTLRKYANQNGDLAEALAVGKDIADDRVEASLYKRAVGYTRTVQKVITDREGGYQIVEFEEEVPPDPKAASWWLSLRRRAEWGMPNAKQTLTINGQAGSEITVSYEVVAPDRATAAKVINGEDNNRFLPKSEHMPGLEKVSITPNDSVLENFPARGGAVRFPRDDGPLGAAVSSDDE